MKFALLVATAAAAGTIKDAAVCKVDADCATATSSCCQSFADADKATAGTPKGDLVCNAAVTTATTKAPFIPKDGCKGRTAGAASLAATAAAAATALYAMC